jgi:hypothetical protein
MQGKLNGMGTERQDSLQRDERLGAVLREAAAAPELLSWRQIEQLVAAAPPARTPWYSSLIHAPAPLRYAMAPFLIAAVSAGTLWVMPAQSQQVGTLVLTALPAAWGDNNAELAEVQQAAQDESAKLGLGQGQLTLMSADRAGQKQLVFTMLEARRPQAEQIIKRLDARYPALSAYTPEYVDITADPAANRLAQLVQEVRHGAGAKQDQTQLARQVLGALHSAGLDDLAIDVQPQADGSLVVEIAATFKMKLAGHTQEELQAAGLDANTLGEARYKQLVEQTGAAADGR